MNILRIVVVLALTCLFTGCVRVATIRGRVAVAEPGSGARFMKACDRQQWLALQDEKGLNRARIQMSWKELGGTSDKTIFTDEDGFFETDLLISGVLARDLFIAASHPLHLDQVEGARSISPMAPWQRTLYMGFELPVAEDVTDHEAAPSLMGESAVE